MLENKSSKSHKQDLQTLHLCALCHRKRAWLCCWAVLNHNKLVIHKRGYSEKKKKAECSVNWKEWRICKSSLTLKGSLMPMSKGWEPSDFPLFQCSGVRLPREQSGSHRRTERGRKHTSFGELEIYSDYFQTFPWNRVLLGDPRSSNNQGTSFWNIRDFVLEKET